MIITKADITKYLRHCVDDKPFMDIPEEFSIASPIVYLKSKKIKIDLPDELRVRTLLHNITLKVNLTKIELPQVTPLREDQRLDSRFAVSFSGTTIGEWYGVAYLHDDKIFLSVMGDCERQGGYSFMRPEVDILKWNIVSEDTKNKLFAFKSTY